MIATFFSVFIAVYLFLFPINDPSPVLAGILVLIGILFVFSQTMITVFAWTPLQAVSLQISPRVNETFIKDRSIIVSYTLLILFLFFTLFTVLDLLFVHVLPANWLLISWVLFMGIAIDTLHHLLKRVMHYLDPLSIIKIFGEKSLESVRGMNPSEISDWINALSEAAVKGIFRNSTTLPIQAIGQLREIAKTYLEAAKSIAFPEEQQGQVGFVLFYLFQRLGMIFDKALSHKLEPLCTEILTTLGKIGIYGAKYDISLATYPLQYIGGFTVRGLDEGFSEIGNRSIATLMEVSKTIIRESDLRYVSIKETFITIIRGLEEITKETFRKDKSISIELLSHPFHDLKQLFQDEKVIEHQDRIIILHEIDQILSEFTTLQTVLSTLPPLPKIEEEKNG